MSKKVKLRAKLPGNEDINGLDAILAQLLEVPEKVIASIVFTDVSTITEHPASGERVPTVEVRRWVVIGDAKKIPAEIKEAVIRLEEARLGKTPLPLDEFTTSGVVSGEVE